MDVLRSKFHELLQRCHANDRCLNNRLKISDKMLGPMGEAPKYVFSPDVMDFIDAHHEDYVDALCVAINAGHFDLPHDPMAVEYDNHPTKEAKNRNFWLISQKGSTYHLVPAMMDNGMAVVFDGYIPMELQGESFIPYDYVGNVVSGLEDIMETLKGQAFVALFFAMALHVRGIVTRNPLPVDQKLDRARAKRGHPPITRDYVTVHIGYVTDRTGKRHDYNEGGGGHVRVHLRRGHTRNQACGYRHQEHKQIWIPATLVNYQPGVAVPETNYLVLP